MAAVTRLYLSGPITATPHYEDAFLNTALILRRAGYQVINPAELCRRPISESDAVRRNLRGLSLAGGLAMLEGYEGHRVVQLELMVARFLNLPVKPWEEWLTLLREDHEERRGPIGTEVHTAVRGAALHLPAREPQGTSDPYCHRGARVYHGNHAPGR